MKEDYFEQGMLEVYTQLMIGRVTLTCNSALNVFPNDDDMTMIMMLW